MNRSGYPVFAVAQFYKIEPQQILVALDDLALPLGRLRLRARADLAATTVSTQS